MTKQERESEQHIAGSALSESNNEEAKIAARSPAQMQGRHLGQRLTRHAIRNAKALVYLIRFAWTWFIFVFLVGLLPVIAKASYRILYYYLGKPASKLLQYPPWSWPWGDVLDWGAFWIPISLVFGALVPAIEYLGKIARQNQDIKNVGTIPRYEPVSDSRPDDKALFDIYSVKTIAKELSEGFLIPDVPIYFVIPPRQGKVFSVRIRTGGTPIDQDFLSSEAAKLGLDWNGFKEWRLQKKREEYDRFVDEIGIRCTDIDDLGDVISLTATKCRFSDYICAELSVNLCAPSRLPDMRRLFEGEQWDNDAVGLSRTNIKDAAKLYSLSTSVSALVTTCDHYLILQRRSKYISEGAGGLAPTASGFARWGIDFKWFDRLSLNQNVFPDVLHKSALRELCEETAIKERHLEHDTKVFVGAAYNLLHGRDLNFYAHFASNLSHREISKLRSKAKDRWEIASLLFVPVKFIDDDGTFKEPFGHLQLECNRHLRGALYAFAKSGKLNEIRKRIC